MKKGIWVSSALAAAAMTLAGPAAAASSATATITGFSFTLYDLDLTDGITPALSFVYENSYSSTNVQSVSESAYDSEGAIGNFQPTSAMSMLPFGEAHASTDSSGGTASGTVSGPSYGGYGYFGASADPISNGFTLTPWTGIKLTATFDGTASTGANPGNNNYASAQGYLQLGISGDNGYEYHYAARQAYASCGTWDGVGCSGESNDFSGTFSVSFANLSDDAVDGYMYMQAYAYGYSTVPVPEPQTYLMLLAGLAGIAAVVRRRRVD